MSWFKVADETTPHLLRNDYAKCEEIVCRALKAEAPSPFHLAMESHFTNDPADVAAGFQAFFDRESERMTVAAIYTETNGFDINPDRWYYDLFGYSSDGGIDDPDWLSDWQSASWPDCTLTGMEELQTVYASNDLGSESSYLSSLLVVIRFQKLIHAARARMNIDEIAVYATGHDYDYIARC